MDDLMYFYIDRTDESMDGCMDGWIDGLLDGWVGVGIDGCMVSISEKIPA
jgi:hypothetical protein